MNSLENILAICYPLIGTTRRLSGIIKAQRHRDRETRIHTVAVTVAFALDWLLTASMLPTLSLCINTRKVTVANIYCSLLTFGTSNKVGHNFISVNMQHLIACRHECEWTCDVRGDPASNLLSAGNQRRTSVTLQRMSAHKQVDGWTYTHGAHCLWW